MKRTFSFFVAHKGPEETAKVERLTTRNLSIILILLVPLLLLSTFPTAKGFDPVASLTLKPGETNLYSAVIDTANGFAYFGTVTSPGIIVKVRLSDFTRVAALTLNPGENYLYSAVIDTANGFAYFGGAADDGTGVIVKIRLSDLTRVGAIILNPGEYSLLSAVIDTANGFAYFGTATSPGIVVKVRLSDFTRQGTLVLNTGEDQLYSAVIDTANGFAYFGSGARNAIAKVRLSDFTEVTSLTLDPSENYLYSAVIDTANGFAYFGTATSPGIVVKVRLSDFTRVGALTLDSSETNLHSAVIDTANGFAYFGTQTSPGVIVKVRLSDLTRVGALALNFGVGGLSSAVIDAANGFAYFGTLPFCYYYCSSSSSIVKVGLTIGFTSTIVSCDSPVIVNQASTCTVTVTDTNTSPTSPLGTVTFTSSALLDTNTCTLLAGAAGTASCSVHATPGSMGQAYVQASYPGDSTHYGSANPYYTFNVDGRSTATTVNCDSPIALDIPYPSSICTVTVTDTSTVGTPVTPYYYSASIVTDSLGSFAGGCYLSGSGSSASCTVAYTPTVVGIHRITANFQSDGYHSPSSGFFDITVNPSTKAPTLTSVSCDTPVVVNQASTCTATVTDTSSGGPTSPSGTVMFQGEPPIPASPYGSFDSNICTLVAGSSGTSSCSVHLTPITTPGISPFDMSLSATYGSDSIHNGSTSSPSSITVNGRSTSTIITCGSPLTLAIPYPISTCTVIVTDTEPAGNPITPYGSYISVSTVTNSTGTFSGGCYLLSGSGVSASCTITYTPTVAGIHRITANYQPYYPYYGGDLIHLASSGFFDLTVNPSTKAFTSTSISCDTPVVVNQVSTCTATVSDTSSTRTASPSGTVTFVGDYYSGSFDSNTCALVAGTTGTSSCSVHLTPMSTPGDTPFDTILSATYDSDSTHNGSTSSPFRITVNGRSTSTTVICDSPVILTIPYPTSTCTVTVTDTSTAGTPITPTGFSTFSTNSTGTFNGGYPYYSYYCYVSGTDVSASCSLTYTPTVVGGHRITVLVQSDGSHSPSSGFFDIFVTPSPKDYTSTSLTCDSPVVVNQVSTCTVTVTDTSPSPTSPTGTVTFAGASFDFDTCTLVGGTTGASSCSVHYTPSSAYSVAVSATYDTDSTHNGSSSTVFTLVVNGRTTTTTVTCTSPVALPDSSTCTITVTDTSTSGTAITPSGSFSPYYNLVSDGSGTFGTGCSISGTGASASCAVNYTPTVTGSDKITAGYAGDSAHSASSAFFLITINPLPLHATTTTVSCDTTVVVNQPSTCTVTVTDTTGSPTPPTGSVSFSVSAPDGISFGSATCTLTPVRFASSTCTDTLIGTRPLVVTVSTSYTGDSAHDPSSGSTGPNVTINPRTATVAVSCVPSTVNVGQASTCTATVTDTSPGTPLLDDQLSGSASVSFSSNDAGTFSSNGPALNVCSLAGTSASGTCSVTYTPIAFGSGTHQITASHAGLVYATSSASSNLIILTNLNPTMTTVSCDTPVVVNQASTCTATVTDTSTSGATSPSGTVTFALSTVYGSFDSNTCALVAGTTGVASCSVHLTIAPFPNPYDVSAAYSGDSTHNTSSSNVFTVTANLRSTSTTITCASPVALPSTSSCTVTVTDTDVGTPITPTGVFGLTTSGAGTFNGQCVLSDTGAAATCTVVYTPAVVGTDRITAGFPGDRSHVASSGFFDISVTPSPKNSTSTSVVCQTVVVGQPSLCTTTVTDTSTIGATSPTLTVTWSLAPGTQGTGTFDSSTCTLAATTAAAASSCSVHFTSNGPGGDTFNIQASYGGDPTHQNSNTIITIAIAGRSSTATITCTTPVIVNTASTCNVIITDTSPAPAVTPTGNFPLTTSGSGFFGPNCQLAGSGAVATCTVNYTPSAPDMHTITAVLPIGGAFSYNTPGTFIITANPAPHTTNTTVSCTPTKVPVHTASYCTATVTDTSTSGANAPSGTVTFTETGIAAGTLFQGSPCTLGTPTPASASCQVIFASANPGVASITASYTPSATDTTHSGSTSATPATVRVSPTFVQLQCYPLVIAVAQSQTCQVAVSATGNAPTGTVSFTVTGVTGTFTPSTCPLTPFGSFGGFCEVTFSAATVGTPTITANYNGDSNYPPDSISVQVTVANLHPTSISLVCSPTTVTRSQLVTCTATVTDTSTSGPTTPTGTIILPIFLPGGSFASCTLSGTSAAATCTGTGNITRVFGPLPPAAIQGATWYDGDTAHDGSTTSFSLSLVRTTTTTISCPATGTVGTAFTCTVTVTDTDVGTTSTPTGTVTVNSVTCTLAGTSASATCIVSINPTAPGSLTVTADYPGDTAHATSTDTATVNVSQPTAHSTSTTITCNPTSVVVGQASVCTATVTDTSTVTPTTPTGTITFTAVGALPGCGPLSGCGILSAISCPLIGGSCFVTFTPSATGSATITGTYGGDSTHATSSGSATVTGTGSLTTTAITCLPASVDIGSASTCTATVTDTSATPTSPTGTVGFTTSGTGTFATSPCTLVAGTATGTASCFVMYTPTGTARTDIITANYAGDTTHGTSSNTANVAVTVAAHSTTTSITCSPTTVVVNQQTTCTTTVTDTSTSPTTPTGTVSFSGGTINPNPCNLTPGSTAGTAACSVTWSAPTIGIGGIVGTYGGDSGHAGSTNSGGTTLITVTLRPTTTTVTCTSSTITTAESSTCTATVTDASPGTPLETPTGDVAFSQTGITSGASFTDSPCLLSAGTTVETATCTVAFSSTSAGSALITGSASTSGDFNGGSTSTGFTVTVTLAAHSTTTSVSCTPSTVSINQATSCTATVTDTSATPTTPTGMVTFTPGGTCTLSHSSSDPIPESTCSVSLTPTTTGQLSISATYGGDGTHSSSQGTTAITVMPPVLNSTSTSVSCSPNTVNVGLPTTCAANVTDTSTTHTSPTGTVTFMSDSSGSFSSSGTCALSATTTGTASCSVTYSPNGIGSGTHTITGSYSGDSPHTTSSGIFQLRVSPPSGQAVQLTFTAFDLDDFDNGVGQLQVLVNGHLAVDIPAGLNHLSGSGDYAPYTNRWVNFGPFDITSFVIQGQNTIIFKSPPPGHFGQVRNVTIAQGGTILLQVSRPNFVTSLHSVTYTFSIPPLVITSFTVSSSSPKVDQTVTFTTTFTGGTAPFKCVFRFGDDESQTVLASANSCSVTHDYDSSGKFKLRVTVVGSSTSDTVSSSLTITVVVPVPPTTSQPASSVIIAATASGRR